MLLPIHVAAGGLAIVLGAVALLVKKGGPIHSSSQMPDPIFEEARSHFTEVELVNLTWAIVVINGWNRMAVSFRSQPGDHQPRSKT